MSNLLDENQNLREVNERISNEVLFKQKESETLFQTNEHCRELIKRNMELEQFVCTVMDDAESRLENLRREVQSKTADLSYSQAKVEELEQRIEELMHSYREFEQLKVSDSELKQRCENLQSALMIET